MKSRRPIRTRLLVHGFFFASLLLAALPAAAALTITGTVKNEAGTGLANVDIDLIDLCTGVNVFLVNDKTAFDGTFSVVVNPGTYDVRFTPPTGSTVASSEIGNYTIAANTNFGTIVLHPGFVVSGEVRDTSGVGISSVALRFTNLATGKRVYVSKDLTTSTGSYSMRVLPGSYDIDYRPPSTTTYFAVRRKGVVVSSDVTGLVDTLGVGVNLNGTVTDSAASPVLYVVVDLYDKCTDEKVPIAHHETDSQGMYSVYVPPGIYSVHYNPPLCKGLAALRVSPVTIDQDGTLDETLPNGFPVSGRVLDNVGQPVQAAKVKFYVGNTRQGATNDETDASGNFSILMAPGTYNINVEPPVGRDLVLGRLDAVNVSGATNLGDIHLSAGIPVAGVLLGPGGAGVENVKVSAVDSATRASILLAHDTTAADGTFRVVVPSGTYDFQYSPPSCTGLAPADQKTVTVNAPVNLPALHLVAGVHAMGRVLDSSSFPVNLANLDFFTPGTQDRFYTPNDTTNASGNYDVFVQPGTYDIVYKPPVGTHLRPVRRSSVSLPTSTTLPDTVLPSGLLVSGFVHSSTSGLPVSGTRVDFYPPGSSTALLTAHNLTATDGSYSIAVDAGTWDVLYTPPAGSGLAPRFRRGVAVSSDVSLPDTLLLPLTVPSVSSVSPPSGTTAGGQTINIGGTGFQPDATVLIGGVAATNINVTSGTSLTCATPPHPAGGVSVTVTNPGNQASTVNGSYTYTEPAGSVQLRVARSGTDRADIVLTWGTTGQTSYTVFRNTSPTGFTGASILTTTPATTYTDTGAASGATTFYVVD